MEPMNTIRYSVLMENPSSHYLDVDIFVNNLSNGKLKVGMPVWTPGSYLIREFARNVQNVRAFDVEGKTLQVSKTVKNVWEIKTAKEKSVHISYKVYAFESGVQTSYFDEERATINGAGVFCYIQGREDDAIELEIKPYKKFKKISTGLEQVRKNVFVAENYDHLIDCPIEIGNQQIYSFDVDGKKHEISIYGSGNLNAKTFLADVKRIVEAARIVFGEYPYSRYLFLIYLLSEKGGGLEHRNSSMIRLQRWNFKQRADYHKQLSLVAHEFFHLWNVKRLKPRHLLHYDFNRENHTPLLWVSEGITSYYENEILKRAGIYSAEEFLESLLDYIEMLEATPGRKAQSIEEASYDAWIKYYRQDENFPNSSVSYYTKGAVVGWMLDMEIRNNSKQSKTLDDALRLLYKETYKRGRGFSAEEFQSVCEKVNGKSLESFFSDYVSGTKDIEYGRWFTFAGLSLRPVKSEGGFLGIRLTSKEGKLYVSNVMQNSPAEKAGMYANDEIISFNGFKVNEKNLQERLAETKPDSPVPIIVAKDERVFSLNVEVGEQPSQQFAVEKVASPAKQQKEFYERWLQQKWDKPLKFAKREIPQERRWI